MNARNFLYLNRYNKGRAKFAADDKLTTKKLFIKNNIPTATIIQAFATRKGLKNYSWDLPKEGFAIKPARGYGGEGILVFKNWDGLSGTTISSRAYTLKQIKSHILDIFDGIYSLQSIPDKAYIEGRIVPHRFFKKFGSMGLPDIRIIVFNKIPIMAMLRIPTEESHGRANLHQGAIGVGIGLRTGITKYAILRNKYLKFIPGTKIKTSGIKIPNWEEIMLLATRAQIVSGLGFAGVDIVVEKKRGPIVLEINARPGLSIQNANLASLRERLERVEALNVPNAERGVEIARSIFAEKFSHKVKEERKILSVIEPVTIFFNGKSGEYKAKIDTGAYRSSIDKSIVEEFGFHLLPDNIHVSSASGGGVRPAIKLEFNLGGKKISTIASVADRSHLQFPIIIGRRDLKGFYVNPLLSHEQKSSRFVDQDDHYEYDLPEE
ncbi:MAG: hypothetical protein A3I54_03235 [Candidatus Levybacteria bacterium RIFCSPLOWO2_02_FULL_41_11]|nr:MAG: hypothetical protein A2869_01175 [Candidatus Levybacteria bacterium RIFCSPHIGHO2_01_FULL_40_58]OGH31624.1 MAG: hypothetical protein A3E43_01330 [Candidatus Levybacteria bacterium RIFCSPHIGHO2_12_FULL_40_31]OGH49514.1 MAG: hypothetical protein A3I54_03235 [Candidatus Levybacteria bacterium RIFCSPLOWO2_02_FULL_41_11]OGH53243.1 MAG: hypothetical protein A3G15_04445 [Candidatus Levybacteria bacterium RIFCSPLOWO2_12_FULL_40_10]